MRSCSSGSEQYLPLKLFVKAEVGVSGLKEDDVYSGHCLGAEMGCANGGDDIAFL